MTPEEIFDLPLPEDDSVPEGVETIGRYLIHLLWTLWVEESEFSGKRPFGESGWKGPIEIALIEAGEVRGKLDEDGYIEWSDDDEVDVAMRKVINLLRPLDPRVGS